MQRSAMALETHQYESDEATRSCAALECSVDGGTRLAVAAAVGTSAFRLHDQRLGFSHSRPVQPLHVAERGLLEAALAHPSATAHLLLAPLKDSAGVVCVRAGPSQPHSRSLLHWPQPVSGCCQATQPGSGPCCSQSTSVSHLGRLSVGRAGPTLSPGVPAWCNVCSKLFAVSLQCTQHQQRGE